MRNQLYRTTLGGWFLLEDGVAYYWMTGRGWLSSLWSVKEVTTKSRLFKLVGNNFKRK